MNKIVVSGSPHVHGEMSVKSIMWGVVIALLPAWVVSLWYFGLGALFITLVAIASCLLIEFVVQKYLLKTEPAISDGSAVVTGLLLAFNVPSSLPWWQVVIGSIVAIGIGKMAFGGLGKNIFNPALVARVFLLVSFPVSMTTWPKPIESRMQLFDFDGLTGATALGELKTRLALGETVSQIKLPTHESLFFGEIGGSLGEVSAIALIIGGIYLLYRRIITWHIPAAYILSTAVFAWILWMVNPEQYIDPTFHLLAGGLMLGAIYMATDMVSSPMTPAGMIVFGIGCGVLTMLIRVFGAYPEGVSFAILIMNAFVPLINKAFKPKRFGEV
jgi:electron transport complex protein RnfD